MENLKVLRKPGCPKRTLRINGGLEIGANTIELFAGPCAVENRDQIFAIAKNLADVGVKVLRGGTYKLRTSPNSFQGLEKEGLKLLKEAANEFKLLVISEITEVNLIDLMDKYVDIYQVGSRSMHNYSLLKELGKIKKTVFLKRGWSSTINELLYSAEYIYSAGNENIILCERGIRSFDTSTRNTLDLSAIPILKEKTQLPVFVDPSHGTGISALVTPMSMAAIAAGADGLLIEVHNKPEQALCDGKQSLNFIEFKKLIESCTQIAKAINKTLLTKN